MQVATPLTIMKVRQLGLLTLPVVFKRMLPSVGKPVNGLPAMLRLTADEGCARLGGILKT